MVGIQLFIESASLLSYYDSPFANTVAHALFCVVINNWKANYLIQARCLRLLLLVQVSHTLQT